MPSTNDIKITISAVNDAKAVFDDIVKSANDLVNTFKTVSKEIGEKTVEGPKKLSEGLKDADESARKAKKGVGEFKDGLEELNLGFEKAVKGAKLLAGGFLAFESIRFLKELGDSAAKVERLGISLDIVGQNAGFTAEEIKSAEENFRALGFSAGASRDALRRAALAEIEFSDALGIATAARELAASAGASDTETLSLLIRAVERGNTTFLRQAGIIINNEEALDKYATALGKTSQQLTESERKTAIIAAIQEKAAQSAGTYARSLGTVSGQLAELGTKQEILAENTGKALLPAYLAVVTQFNILLENLNLVSEKTDEFGTGATALGVVVNALASGIRNLIEAIVEFKVEIGAIAAIVLGSKLFTFLKAGFTAARLPTIALTVAVLALITAYKELKDFFSGGTGVERANEALEEQREVVEELVERYKALSAAGEKSAGPLLEITRKQLEVARERLALLEEELEKSKQQQQVVDEKAKADRDAKKATEDLKRGLDALRQSSGVVFKEGIKQSSDFTQNLDILNKGIEDVRVNGDKAETTIAELTFQFEQLAQSVRFSGDLNALNVALGNLALAAGNTPEVIERLGRVFVTAALGVKKTAEEQNSALTAYVSNLRKLEDAAKEAGIAQAQQRETAAIQLALVEQEEAYRKGQITIQDFYALKREELDASVRHEIQTLEQQRSAIQRQQEIYGVSDEQRSQFATQLIQIETQLNQKRSEFAVRSAQIANEEAQAIEAASDRILNARIKLLQAQGNTIEAESRSISNQLIDDLEALGANAPGASLAQQDAARDLEQTAAIKLRNLELDRDSEQITLRKIQLQSDLVGLDNQLTTGAISRNEYEEDVRLIFQQKLDIAREELAVLQQRQASGRNDVQLLQQIIEKQREVGDLVVQQATLFNEYALSIKSSLKSSTGEFFTDILDGTKTWKEALLDALESFRRRINQLVADKLVDQLLGVNQTSTPGGSGGGLLGNLFNALLSFGGSSGGAAGGSAAGAGSFYGQGLIGTGFAEGGVVSGPGGPTSDSINARLSDGEFVVNAKSTSRWLPILHAINEGMSDFSRYALPRAPRFAFAAGGLVDNDVGFSSTNRGAVTLVNNFNVRGDSLMSRRTREHTAADMAVVLERARVRGDI